MLWPPEDRILWFSLFGVDCAEILWSSGNRPVALMAMLVHKFVAQLLFEE